MLRSWVADDMSFASGNVVASANAPLTKLMGGIQEYISAGVPRSKLVVGLPWFGYNFACTNNTAGAPCTRNTSAELGSIGYADALGLAESNSSLTPVTYDRATASCWFDYLDAAEPPARHRVWFDTPTSLAVKYSAVRAAGLRGIAIWETAAVEEGGPLPSYAGLGAAMWDTLAAFATPHGNVSGMAV